MFAGIIKKIQSIIEGNENIKHSLSENKKHKFVLLLEYRNRKIEVGYLFTENNKWFFQYTDEFKDLSKKENISVIPNFPKLEKIYESNYLWPFFSYRIPSTKRDDIRVILKKEKINENDIVALLKKFGEKTIFNHYLLKPVT